MQTTDLSFANSGDALAHMDQLEKDAIAQLEAEALAQMEADASDPRSNSYFMRLDTKTVVKDEKEYVACQMHRVPMKVIPYGHALHLLKEEDAKRRSRLKAKKKRKTAKAARRANR